MNALVVYYIHYKGNKIHSTVNLFPGNGLVITRHILVGQKGSQGKSKLSSLKKTSNVSVASNQSPFWVWTVPTRNQTKEFCYNTSRSELFKAISGLNVSRSESIKITLVWTFLSLGINIKQLRFEYFSLGIISQNKFGLNVSRSESHPYLGYIFCGFIARLQWNLQRFCVFFFRHRENGRLQHAKLSPKLCIQQSSSSYTWIRSSCS